VIGIGDMSGDVFGNGMLRSRRLKLRAAFDHRHVFLDPEPDPERSYWERERLFRLQRSSWSDYAASCLSEGGGVFERSAKSIPLSAPARAMLGVPAESLPGEEVVSAILRMQVDLLWNGGIGTYVKATDETQAEVGDPANDAVRIDARELRVAVVIEGGNLGLTPRARVEFALGGGRVDSDAIDNSGGVDLSDHEVNLKIALRSAVARRDLSTDDRNALLAELADEVCESVLAHSRSQSLALHLDQVRSLRALFAFRDLMVMLEAESGLDRRLEALPTRDELRARRGSYRGLTRPELAVLLALAKLHHQRVVLDSPLAEDRQAETYVRRYFPRRIDERFPQAVLRHPLRPEITAVELANRMVDTMGVTFLTRLGRDTGRDAAELVKAWTAAMLLGGAEETLQRIVSRHSSLSLEAEEQCYFAVDGALERATRWIAETQPPALSLGNLVERFKRIAADLLADWQDLLPEEAAHARSAEIERLRALGVDEPLAADLTRLAALDDALEVAHIAAEQETDPVAVAYAYFHGATLLDLEWVRRALPRTTAGEDRWEQRAVGGLLEGLLYARRQLTVGILEARDGAPVAEGLRRYAERLAPQLGRVRGIIDDLKAEPTPTLSGMVVVMRELGQMLRPAAH
jgi:glutamate dehydrogenase